MSKMSAREAGQLGGIKTKEIWRKRYNENPRYCNACNAKLSYERRHNKFCDHRCSAIYNNALKERKEKICVHCGSIIRDYKFWQTRKYCSSQCQANYQWHQAKVKFVENGRISSKVGAKRYLAEIHGKKCSICGIDEWMGQPVLLILDHVDGDATNCAIDNLRLVCSNCDAQLPTYKGRNMGRGRHYRKMRYHYGKSY